MLVALEPLSRDPAASSEYALHSGTMYLLAALAFALAILSQVLIRALRRGKRWAWITASVLFALYLLSAFLPLGAAGLFGLMSKGTRARFRAADRDSTPHER